MFVALVKSFKDETAGKPSVNSAILVANIKPEAR